MILGDARCPVGSCRTVAHILMCEMDNGQQPLYKLMPAVLLAAGVEVLFQQHHLMPLDGGVETIVMDEALKIYG
jgi:hypothetical protein